MTDDPQERWLHGLRRQLDRSTQTLDPDTLAALQRARAAALARRPRGTPALRPAWGGLALAASLLLGLMLWQPWSVPPAGPAALEDLELLASADRLELFEDLQFYLWLEQQSEEQPAAPGDPV